MSTNTRVVHLHRASLFHKDLNTVWGKTISEDRDDVDDSLGQAQQALSELKHKISIQSKKNFALERDVRYLDSRIAMLINHRISFEEIADHLEDADQTIATGAIKDERTRQQYSNLFYLLQTKPAYMAKLARLLSLAEIDGLLQTVMFTLYGNQYESREEHLLLSFFEVALKMEFEEAIDMGSVMRANTAVSRMMTTYTRRGPGQEYLKYALGDMIRTILNDSSLNLEIEPLKIYEQLINDTETKTGETSRLSRSLGSEEIAAHPEVQAIIPERVAALTKVTSDFLNIIIGSLDLVPYGIRWLCKKIRQLMKQYYPEGTTENIASIIGGFFLLRFVNPAIVTPQAYMLIKDKPTPIASRNLTLVAKLLQNLANKPNFKKEPYMLPLNDFTIASQQKVQLFLNKLCEVDDFYEALELDLYKALTAKEIVLNITLNEMYNIHKLLKSHIEDLIPEKDDHVRVIVDEMSPAPEQLARKDNKTVALHLFSRFENDSSTDGVVPVRRDSNGSAEITSNSVLLLDSKSNALKIIRLEPEIAGKNPQEAPKTVEELLQRAEKSSSTKVVSLAALTKQSFDSLKHQSNTPIDSEKICNDILQKFMGLAKIREKVETELESLSHVFRNICDHNNFLIQQLDAYKVYLLNVRSQAGAGTTLKSLDKLNKLQHGTAQKNKATGPFKFDHSKLEKDGVIVESDVPENRRGNIYFSFSSPSPGNFLIALHYKGRDKAILKMNLKLDDLLEKQYTNQQLLDLEYVQLNVNKTIHLLNKTFLSG